MESSTRRRRAISMFAAGLGASLLLTGCGFDAQTLQPYTPANGVNVEVPAGEDNRLLKVRNLLVVADEDGAGIVSASIVSPVADSLVGIAGNANRSDNTAGAPLSVSGGPVALEPNRLAVLTDPQPTFTVTSPDLQPGLTVDLTLTFASGAQASAIAPVMSAEDAIYATISAAPTTASPEAASPTASPDAAG